MESPTEHELAFLLDFDGTRYLFEEGYWMKIVVKRVAASRQRPHGLAYSLTLHAANGDRLMGFDNAHGAPSRGGRHKPKPAPHDHWHRNLTDPGRPYDFQSASQLVQDFLNEVERILRERGVSAVAIDEEDRSSERNKSEGSKLGRVPK